MEHRGKTVNGKYLIEIRTGFRWRVKYEFDNQQEQKKKLDELDNEKFNKKYFSDLKFGCNSFEK